MSLSVSQVERQALHLGADGVSQQVAQIPAEAARAVADVVPRSAHGGSAQVHSNLPTQPVSNRFASASATPSTRAAPHQVISQDEYQGTTNFEPFAEQETPDTNLPGQPTTKRNNMEVEPGEDHTKKLTGRYGYFQMRGGWEATSGWSGSDYKVPIGKTAPSMDDADLAHVQPMLVPQTNANAIHIGCSTTEIEPQLNCQQ